MYAWVFLLTWTFVAFFIKEISLFVQTKYLLKNQTSQFDLLHLRNEE